MNFFKLFFNIVLITFLKSKIYEFYKIVLTILIFLKGFFLWQ
jgi:hypothetical protein